MMCIDLIRPYKRYEFTGYKIVALINGEAYSPIIGVKYDIGKVPIPEKSNPIVSGHEFMHGKLSEIALYDKEYVGYTSVFVNIKHAKKELEALKWQTNEELIIIGMTLENELKEGLYEGDKVIAGKYVSELCQYKILTKKQRVRVYKKAWEMFDSDHVFRQLGLCYLINEAAYKVLETSFAISVYNSNMRKIYWPEFNSFKPEDADSYWFPDSDRASRKKIIKALAEGKKRKDIS